MSTIRTVCALAAFVICFAEGARRSVMLKKRAAMLEELRLLLAEFAIEIRCAAPTLDELFLRAEGGFAELFRECRSESADVRAAWENACARLAALSFCKAEEAELMRTLGRSLGTSDKEGQLSLLEMYSQKLLSLRESADKDYAAKGRLFRSVGALCGAGAAILII